MQIDPARRGKMPKVDPARPFRSGRITGWRLGMPGGLALATPAVTGGRVFLGGGFGSYEFYAFDADTGDMLWQHQTTDDGPTAAVIEDEYVVFNTESCELEVVTVEGKPVWKKWLGDPLMSMPAVDKGKLYMAYPDSHHGGDHYIACFDLKTGAQYWRSPIAGDIITAPVLIDDRVYLTTLEGTIYCFDQFDGNLLWREAKNATSAPVVVGGQCYFSQRLEVPVTDGCQGMQQTEHCAARGVQAASATVPFAATARVADYLDHAKRRRRSPQYRAYEAADAGVGFASHKGSAKIAQAMKNLGQAHVSGVWAYQGSKPFLSKGRLFSPMGDTLQCVAVETGELVWSKKVVQQPHSGEELLDSVLTPPALVNDKAFIGTSSGEVHCLAAETGESLWSAHVGEPILFQPAVAHGRVYLVTQLGGLFCLETGDPSDDGWLMWGATPAHNGLPDFSAEPVFADGGKILLEPA